MRVDGRSLCVDQAALFSYLPHAKCSSCKPAMEVSLLAFKLGCRGGQRSANTGRKIERVFRLQGCCEKCSSEIQMLSLLLRR